MFKLGVSIVLLSVLAVQVSSDQIVVGALTKIFKYATPASVKTLTNNINKQTTKPKAVTVLNNWIPKNFKAANAKLDAKDQYSKQAYAKTKATTFIDMRYSLKKYINYLYNQAVNTKYLTAAEADKMRKLFWQADAKTDNNFTATCELVASQGSQALVKNPPIMTKLQEYAGAFAKANPKDYQNLQWKL